MSPSNAKSPAERNNTIIIVVSYLCLLYLVISFATKSGFFDSTEPVIYNEIEFSVLSSMPKKEEAAKILHDVDSQIDKIRKHIDSKFSNDYILDQEVKFKGKGDLLRKIKRRLSTTYKRDSLKENYPSKPKVDVSYNLNKGNTIALCLRNYENVEDFHEFNEIMFVSIHELAHSLNCDETSLLCGNSYGHDNMFWYIFKILLENAIECGAYKKKDYRDSPVQYCSMKITYSPLYDKSLDDLNMVRTEWS